MIILGFQYDHVKSKYGEKPKLCYRFMFYSIKTDDIFKDIAENVETRFNTLN